MPKPYSCDLRGRVIGEVVGGASRREAAERFGISPSVVIIWAQRFEETGSVAAKPSGGSTSPLEDHALIFLLAHIAGGRPLHSRAFRTSRAPASFAPALDRKRRKY